METALKINEVVKMAYMTNHLFDKKFSDSQDEWEQADSNGRVIYMNRRPPQARAGSGMRISPLTKLLIAFNVVMVIAIVAVLFWTPSHRSSRAPQGAVTATR